MPQSDDDWSVGWGEGDLCKPSPKLGTWTNKARKAREEAAKYAPESGSKPRKTETYTEDER